MMYRWYHANLDNKNAERLLMERGSDGSYLVRPSKSCSGHFSLSVRRNDTVTHIKIRRTGDFYDLHGGEQFATLSELIQHYAENQLKEKNGDVFELKKPLNSSDPITERWFHGSINGATAERMVRENGVNGSFLVRESQSRIGDYVLTVRVKDDQNDKVTHVVIRHHDNRYDVGGGEKFDSLTDLVEHYKRNPMVETNGSVINMICPFNATRITALDIGARIKELSKENASQANGKDGFWEEFEQLQHQECKVLFDRKVAQEDRNISKNRYKNILPFDYTRVILNRKPFPYTSDEKSGRRSSTSNEDDYINANYIKLVEDEMHISRTSKPLPNSKIYIATQGPLSTTVDDFWWMVWQERSECIVMATREVERDKNKCHRYWPTLEQGFIVAGPLEIKILTDSSSSKTSERDYVCREFELRFIGAGENMHRVTQYQYFAWPDQNIPAQPSSALGFLKEINERPAKGPMIVHCSAGIGRSGTLIVIDMLIDQMKYHGMNYEIDIQRVVKIVRAQRSGLVQTESQYRFIYLAMQEYITSMS